MCEVVITLLICFFVLSYLVFLLVFALKGLRLALLWATGTKDSERFSARFGPHHAEWVKERIARGQPATLGGVLKLLGQRVWTAYRHPIRAWRGEFDPPKKGPPSTGKA
jgi:hypothetical protein